MDLALFDFDGTITDRETMPAFMHEAVRHRRLLIGKILLSPLILGYKARVVSGRFVRAAICFFGFRGVPATELENDGERNARPRFARFSVVGNVVGFIGRALTAVAGVFIAGIDLYRAKREFNRRNYAMGWLHLGSAFAGGGFALALLFSSVAWGGIFLLLVIITTVAMMVWSDDKRHGWLDRCFWGRFEAERYASAEIEKKEYELAAGIY